MKKEFLYDGKAKTIYKTDKADEIIMEYKDSATAFNGIKKAKIESKGVLNNKISTHIFKYLEENNVPTHFIEQIDERTQRCKKVEIIPLEYICRNVIAGSMAKRLGLKDGTEIDSPIFEICYKNDEYGDPLINDYHAVAIGLVTKKNLEKSYGYLEEINKLLISLFEKANIKLIDFKIEFGIDSNGDVVLADEISPDSCRLWDKDTNERLDKDVFRLDIGQIADAYNVVIDRLEI